MSVTQGIPLEVVVKQLLNDIGTRLLKHLNIYEREVAKWYFETNPIKGYYLFDVPLIRPKVLEYVRNWPEPLKRQALYLTAWKIDAVCITGKEHILIEFKNYATERVIGQMAWYDKLYREQYRPDKPVRWLVVCNTIKEELLETLKRLGVEVRVRLRIL